MHCAQIYQCSWRTVLLVTQVHTAENSQDTPFLCDMAFLTDITAHLNHLNARLQGKDQTVCDLYSHMTAFQHKLGLFIEGFSVPNANLAHFPACAEMRKDNPECANQIQKYKADIEKLQEQFSDRFQDFHHMQPRMFNDTLFAEVSAQPPELQLELCEL